jgi:hypothetical protein
MVTAGNICFATFTGGNLCETINRTGTINRIWSELDMNKRIIGAFLLGAALCISSGSARAAQNVANTSQKGSLLIFPAIDVDPGDDAADTLVEISNDQTSAVHVECEYVNQQKDRVNFDFNLTGKATASWDVYSGFGENVAAPTFPSGGTFTPGNPNQGELVCFAVSQDSTKQIAFNNLTGTATLVFQDDGDANQYRQAFRYNAWAFTARNSSGGSAADNTVQGTPGTLLLTGGGAGTYDACPLYNVANFMPNGATLTPVTTFDNDLWVSSCNQDLTQDFKVHITKLLFTVWNSNENSFTGSFACADSTSFLPLSAADASPNYFPLTNPSSFDFSRLRTANARFQVQGIASTQCSRPVASEAAGLLGVLSSSIGINDPSSEDAELGSNTFGAGVQSGYVKWNPAGTVVPRPRR